MSEEKKADPQALKERVGKHLRTADEFTRSNRYEEAIMEIELALEIDPKNNYARSFLERVKLMHKRSQQKETDQPASKEMSLEERMDLISKHLSAAEDYINKKEYKLALEEVARVYKIDSKNYYAQTYSERIETLMLEENTEVAKLAKTDVLPVHPDTQHSLPPERGSTLMYRELLKDVWLDGKVTDAEAQKLADMRQIFGITPEEHSQLEREIKIDAYLEALHLAWRDNTLSDIEQKTLMMMRDKYDISQEDQAIAEKRYENIKHPSKSRGTVLIVDSDRETLVSLGKILKQNSITIFMAQKTEDALQILSNQTPNLILSEILFPAHQIDGVGFLKKIRAHSTLKRVPIIFISTITDKKVIQASYRLGIDHFISKPIDIDILLAIIEGKLCISI